MFVEFNNLDYLGMKVLLNTHHIIQVRERGKSSTEIFLSDRDEAMIVEGGFDQVANRIVRKANGPN